MPNVYIEIAKVFAPIVGVIVGALLGPFVKGLDYKRQERQEYDKLGYSKDSFLRQPFVPLKQ